MIWNIFHDDVIQIDRITQLGIFYLVSLRTNVDHVRYGARVNGWMIGNCLGRNYYQWFVFFFYLIPLSRLSIGAELFLDKIVVENDAIKDDFCDIGEDQPEIEDTIWAFLII